MKFFRRREEPIAPPVAAKIDAVTVTGGGVVALVMGYATSTPIDSIQQRVQAYVSFALDGPLSAQFPETAGKPVQILIAPDDAPSAELQAYVDMVRPKLAGYGVGIEIQVPGAGSVNTTQ